MTKALLTWPGALSICWKFAEILDGMSNGLHDDPNQNFSEKKDTFSLFSVQLTHARTIYISRSFSSKKVAYYLVIKIVFHYFLDYEADEKWQMESAPDLGMEIFIALHHIIVMLVFDSVRTVFQPPFLRFQIPLCTYYNNHLL